MSRTTKRPPARRWQLLGYRGKDVVHDSICASDEDLDKAMRVLEVDQTIKITVKAL